MKLNVETLTRDSKSEPNIITDLGNIKVDIDKTSLEVECFIKSTHRERTKPIIVIKKTRFGKNYTTKFNGTVDDLLEKIKKSDDLETLEDEFDDFKETKAKVLNTVLESYVNDIENMSIKQSDELYESLVKIFGFKPTATIEGIGL